MPDYNLNKAYSIDGAHDARALYDNWSDTYDASFGDGHGYIAPREIAELFKDLRGDANTPILDIGAGTGLVAEHLDGLVVDGIDISQGMLDKAAAKGLYRNRILADLTRALPIEDATYGGFVSCGTFTHGHVGAEALPELMRIAKPGALFVCGTLPAVFDAAGLGSTLAVMVAQGTLGPLEFRDIPIYDDLADHEHAQMRGLVMVFRKT